MNGPFLYNEKSPFKDVRKNILISALFKFLLVSTISFEKLSILHGNYNNFFYFPIFFQRFIVALFYSPNERSNSEEQVTRVLGDKFNRYFINLN